MSSPLQPNFGFRKILPFLTWKIVTMDTRLSLWQGFLDTLLMQGHLWVPSAQDLLAAGSSNVDSGGQCYGIDLPQPPGRNFHVPALVSRPNSCRGELAPRLDIDSVWTMANGLCIHRCLRNFSWKLWKLDVCFLPSRFNRKLPRRVSKARDAWAIALDALLTQWDNFWLMYAFPPLKFLLACSAGSEWRPF